MTNRKKDFFFENKNKNKKKESFFQKKYEKNFGEGIFDELKKNQKIILNNQYIRVNSDKTEVLNFLKKNRFKYIETFIDNCIKIEKSFFSISSSYLNLTGKIYLQDLASQIVVNTITEDLYKKKDKILILDMCSSPGSKITQLAKKLENKKIKYEIICLEPNKTRLLRLINNIQKQNCKNISILNILAENFISEKKFDLILLDAPCSGNFLSDKNWFSKRDQIGINNNAQLQKKLIKKAKELISQKGEIIYSTCSLEIEENEENINYAVQKLHLKTKQIDLKIPFSTKPVLKFENKIFDTTVKNSIRFMPNVSKTEGFFICKLVK